MRAYCITGVRVTECCQLESKRVLKDIIWKSYVKKCVQQEFSIKKSPKMAFFDEGKLCLFYSIGKCATQRYLLRERHVYTQFKAFLTLNLFFYISFTK